MVKKRRGEERERKKKMIFKFFIQILFAFLCFVRFLREKNKNSSTEKNKNSSIKLD